MTGLPGLRGVDHVGFAVPDLDAAVAFFVDVLGAEHLFTHGPYRSEGDVQERQFARHRDTEVRGIAMLRLGGQNVELLEFYAPDQRPRMPRTSDAGGHHLAVYVDDMGAAVAHLRQHNVAVLGEPMALPGPEAGVDAQFVFAVAPWGLALEFVSYPHGKAYEATTTSRLFDPRRLPQAGFRPLGA